MKNVSGVIKHELREYDIASRYGGEEFCILLPDTTINEAEFVAQRLRKAVENTDINITEEQLAQADLSGTPFANLTPEQREDLGNLNWDRLGITADDILGLLGDIPRDTQISEIESSPLPQFLKDALLENNNSIIYEELGANSFPEYVAAYVSRMVLNVVSFLVTFLLAIIIVKALMVAVNIIGELPVLGLVNHLAGAVLGVVLGLVLVWVGFLVITLLYTTQVGMACFEMIEKSSILTFLYNANPLLNRLLGF